MRIEGAIHPLRGAIGFTREACAVWSQLGQSSVVLLPAKGGMLWMAA